MQLRRSIGIVCFNDILNGCYQTVAHDRDRTSVKFSSGKASQVHYLTVCILYKWEFVITEFLTSEFVTSLRVRYIRVCYIRVRYIRVRYIRVRYI